MSWEITSFFFGLGLALFTSVITMIGIRFPGWLIAILLIVSAIFMGVGPLSFLVERSIIPPIVASALIGFIIVLALRRFIWPPPNIGYFRVLAAQNKDGEFQTQTVGMGKGAHVENYWIYPADHSDSDDPLYYSRGHRNPHGKVYFPPGTRNWYEYLQTGNWRIDFDYNDGTGSLEQLSVEIFSGKIRQHIKITDRDTGRVLYTEDL